MRTTIPKLRRIIRKTLTEATGGLDQEHLKDLANWISRATEDGEEADYDATVDSYMTACAEEGSPVTQEFVEEHLDNILDEHESIVDEGGLVLDLDYMDDEDSEEY